MEDLQDFLKEKKYKKVKFKVLKTQHLLITAKINGIKGNFILDTGASNSCVGFESIERFFLNAQFSETKAAGAGAVGMETQLAKNNEKFRTNHPIFHFLKPQKLHQKHHDNEY